MPTDQQNKGKQMADGRLIVFSGAGLSAESGIQTFRDKDGLWDGHKIEQVCDIRTWKDNFDAVHEFYNKRKAEGRAASPNAAHLKIAEWQKTYPDMVIMTQNVDPLLEMAGCTDVVHLHGEIKDMHCTGCGHVWEHGLDDYDPTTGCPKCPCKKGVKPSVVFFHESAPKYAALYGLLETLTEQDVFIVIGTSSQVVPINHFLSSKVCVKFLNILAPAADEAEALLDEMVYDKCFFMPATQAVEEMDVYLKKLLA